MREREAEFHFFRTFVIDEKTFFFRLVKLSSAMYSNFLLHFRFAERREESGKETEEL